MNRIIFTLLMLFALSMLFSDRPSAQFGEGGTIVTACGTLPQAYVVGQIRSLTQDTTGKVC